MNQRFLGVFLAGSVGILSACGGQVMMPDDDGGAGGTDATGGTGHGGTGGPGGAGAMGGHAGTGATGGYAGTGTGAMGGYAGTGAMGGYAGTGTGAMGGYAGTGTGAMGGYAGTGAMGGYAGTGTGAMGGGPPDCSATQDCFGCCASVYISQMAYVNKLWLGCGGCSDLCPDACQQQICQDPTMIPYDECRACFMDTMQQNCMSELVSCLGDASCAPIVQCWLACP